MKIKLAYAILAIAMFSMKSYGQVAFSVSPGLNFNSASIGYKIGDRIVPFVAFQYAGAKLTSTITTTSMYRSYSDPVVNTYKGEGNVKLFVPSIGAKVFIANKNKLKAFANITLSKPIIKGKSKVDGETNDEFEEMIDGVKLWGGEFGLGAEYYFDENFSIGGEFGLRYIHLKSKTTDDSSTDGNYYYGSSYSEKTENELSLNVMPTYSKISLNFYF